MKNYQALYYKDYFAQNHNGDYIPVNRKDCFAPGETPTFIVGGALSNQSAYDVRIGAADYFSTTYRK